MNTFLTKPLKFKLGQNVNDVQAVCKFVGVSPSKAKVWLYKQSVDARKKDDVHFVCSYVVQTDKSQLKNATPFSLPQDYLENPTKTQRSQKVIVVGAGPAGLFSARYLSAVGFDITVVEKGADVEQRRLDVEEFFRGGKFNAKSNVQFGLGGAGTFSDGKLTTGISSPLTATVFNEFVRSGAPKEILTSNLPHIGTDKLVSVVANLRNSIVQSGGKFLFNTTVTNFVVQNGVCYGVQLDDGRTLLCDHVLLCCGHSARDVFQLLCNMGVEMQFKPFAVGVRIEHTRDFVNKSQYGMFATHKDLGSASYKLAHQVDKTHACYSFCMCPGGVVVPANSTENAVVVNGMSYHARNQVNSNSALVVSVTKEDVEAYGFGTDCLAGMRFQQHLENLAFQVGGGNYVAPSQSVASFCNVQQVGETVTPSYPRGVQQCNLHDILPQQICHCLEQGLQAFNKKIHGFGTSGVLTGVETRTSSPVKILRNGAFHSSIANLYPVGEGAGYAGGIVSSAVDGLRVAMSIADN